MGQRLALWQCSGRLYLAGRLNRASVVFVCLSLYSGSGFF